MQTIESSRSMQRFPINSKKELLMQSLSKFFSLNKNINELINITSGKSGISLRVLDWFVTNYAKKNGTSYLLKDKKKKNFIVHLDYKSQLKAYSKKQFDPFCRRERISFIDNQDREITTTVGQLNFFRWAIENKIIDFIKKNLETIEKDMTTSLKKVYGKKNKNKKERRKRQELSISATKSVKKYDVSIVVKFD